MWDWETGGISNCTLRHSYPGCRLQYHKVPHAHDSLDSFSCCAYGCWALLIRYALACCVGEKVNRALIPRHEDIRSAPAPSSAIPISTLHLQSGIIYECLFSVLISSMIAAQSKICRRSRTVQ